jgi:hypothetical protein
VSPRKRQETADLPVVSCLFLEEPEAKSQGIHMKVGKLIYIGKEKFIGEMGDKPCLFCFILGYYTGV